MHVAFCLVNFQECERMTKKPQKEQFRSIGFGQWKAGSQEYQVRTMKSRITRVTGSDDGKLNRRSIGFGQWKAGSQEYQVRTMESRIAGVTGSDHGKLNRRSIGF